MYQATRPFEYICFFPAEFPTQIDGDVYAFIFVDVYSGRSIENILKHIRLLTWNKDFLSHKGKPFTLILHKYEELKDDILHIIEPFKGKFLVNDVFVAEKIAPVLESLFATLSDNTKRNGTLLN